MLQKLHRQALDQPVVNSPLFFRQSAISEDGKRTYFIPESKKVLTVS